MAADIKTNIRRGIEAFNDPGRHDEWMDLHDRSIIAYGYAPEPLDFEGLRAFYESLWAAFPDIQATIEDVIQEGETAATRVTLRGTHQGEFVGVPASGRSVEFTVMGFYRFREDKALERWVAADLLTMMVQVGAIPAPAAPSTAT